MTDFLQISEQASPLDTNVVNYAAADIPAYSAVIIDTGNVISVNNLIDGIAVKLPAASTGQPVIGVTMETIRGTTFTGGPPGVGRLRPLGIAKVVATAAVTAGTVLMTDATGNGTVITQTAGKYQLGVALSAAVNSGDEVAVLVAPANNA